MSELRVQPSDPSTFMDAELRPNRSLGRFGFVWLMAVVAGINFLAGLYFLSLGAWPIIGFCLLDVALVYIAFRISYRVGRRRETVTVTSDELTVRKITPSGKVRAWRLHPFWAQVIVDRIGEHDAQIRLVSHGKSLVIGAFLAPEERQSFAEALKSALQEARSPALETGS